MPRVEFRWPTVAGDNLVIDRAGWQCTAKSPTNRVVGADSSRPMSIGSATATAPSHSAVPTAL